MASTQAQKDHYQKNKEIYRDRLNARRAEWLKWFWEYKCRLQCERCKESHPACIDFHHKDPKEKLKGVSQMVSEALAKEKILAEIAKCMVLCSNCHRKLHHEERGGSTIWV